MLRACVCAVVLTFVRTSSTVAVAGVGGPGQRRVAPRSAPLVRSSGSACNPPLPSVLPPPALLREGGDGGGAGGGDTEDEDAIARLHSLIQWGSSQQLVVQLKVEAGLPYLFRKGSNRGNAVMLFKGQRNRYQPMMLSDGTLPDVELDGRCSAESGDVIEASHLDEDDSPTEEQLWAQAVQHAGPSPLGDDSIIACIQRLGTLLGCKWTVRDGKPTLKRKGGQVVVPAEVANARFYCALCNGASKDEKARLLLSRGKDDEGHVCWVITLPIEHTGHGVPSLSSVPSLSAAAAHDAVATAADVDPRGFFKSAIECRMSFSQVQYLYRKFLGVDVCALYGETTVRNRFNAVAKESACVLVNAGVAVADTVCV